MLPGPAQHNSPCRSINNSRRVCLLWGLVLLAAACEASLQRCPTRCRRTAHGLSQCAHAARASSVFAYPPQCAVKMQLRAGQGQPSPAGRVEQRLPGALPRSLPVQEPSTAADSGLAGRVGGALLCSLLRPAGAAVAYSSLA